MALDIRLDFVKNIRNEFIDQMTSIRSDFIALDSRLITMADNTIDPAALRTISIARTELETACQYAIKSLCLMGEIKEPTNAA